MYRTMRVGLVTLVAVLVTSSAWATITLEPVPPLNATITAHPYLFVDFKDPGGTHFAYARATVIEKTLNSFGTANYNLKYLASNLVSNDGYGWNGIRIVELVTNETNTTWTDYHVAFTAPPGTFYWQAAGSGATPSTYLVTGSGDNWSAELAPSLATVVVAPASNPNQVDFYFTPGNEVEPGESFGLYVAAQPFDMSVDGTMNIVQYATSPIPEPLSLVVWSVIGGLGLGGAWLRRNRQARSPRFPADLH